MISPFSLAKILWVIPFASCLADSVSEQPEFPNPSSFRTENIARNPFSQIQKAGSPQIETAKESAGSPTGTKTGVRIGPELFKVTTISTNGGGAAIINGRAYSSGEIVTVGTPDGRRIGVTVLKINDQQIILESEGNQLIVPLSKAK